MLIDDFIGILVENGNGVAKAKKKFVHPKKTTEERKLEKEKRKIRKARVILRNLPFKITENDLNKEFSKYGAIKECNILKREDGKLVGCAFIQYDKVNHAAKAIHHANGKEMFGRPIIIDWAVNRKTFAKHIRQQKQSNKKVQVKTEEMEIKQESDDENSDNNDDADADDDQEHDEVDGEEAEEYSEASDSDEEEDEKKKPIHQKSNDVAEGCTVFIKNIPFESTNDDLYKVCRQFGPLYYAVITVDKISGHSKGNGFVKFKVTST